MVHGLDELLCLVGAEQDQDHQRADEDQGEVLHQPGGQLDLLEAGLLPAAAELDQSFGEASPVGEDAQVLDGLSVGEIVTGAAKGDSRFWPRPTP